jgi:hypothetical protein
MFYITVWFDDLVNYFENKNNLVLSNACFGSLKQLTEGKERTRQRKKRRFAHSLNWR